MEPIALTVRGGIAEAAEIVLPNPLTCTGVYFLYYHVQIETLFYEGFLPNNHVA